MVGTGSALPTSESASEPGAQLPRRRLLFRCQHAECFTQIGVALLALALGFGAQRRWWAAGAAAGAVVAHPARGEGIHRAHRRLPAFAGPAGEGREPTQEILARLDGVSIGRVTTREPTLEDAYVALVTDPAEAQSAHVVV